MVVMCMLQIMDCLLLSVYLREIFRAHTPTPTNIRTRAKRTRIVAYTHLFIDQR